MIEVGTFEAKNRLSEILRVVESGEGVRITRRGVTVAIIMPPEQGEKLEARRKWRKWKSVMDKANISPQEIAEWKNEGRE